MSDYGTPPPPPAAGYQPPSASYQAPPAPAGYGTPVQGGELASWPVRVGGYIIDQLVMLPGWILYIIGAPKTWNASTTMGDSTNAVSGADNGNIPLMLLGLLIMLGIGIWNRWIKGGQGQTIGKKVVGIKLVSEQTGQPIGTAMAFVRDIAHILDSIICGLPIGWLWPLWDAKKQTWGDKVVKTLVFTVAK
jgi:uncharacterized RDD family membrane protein YckC